MEVTELTAEAFWKGETEIRGTVMDGEDEYNVSVSCARVVRILTTLVRISVKRKKSRLCGVSCTQGPDRIPMCPHAHALLAEWLGERAGSRNIRSPHPRKSGLWSGSTRTAR